MRFHAAQHLRTHSVFFVATAAVMFHVADDNYFQPANGVAPVDHLVSGLVPLGFLSIAAWAYPRVREGARALIALAVGYVGLVIGVIEAGYYSVTVGPSGDDYSGFAAAAAGVVLTGLAVRILWRSRRAGPTRTRRYLRRTVVGVLCLAVFAEVVLPFAFAYMITHVGRAEVPAPHLGAAHEDITLTTTDGLHLHGWYVPSRNRAAVLLFAGRKKWQPHARMLVSHGYGVLLLDRRGEGASDGDNNHFGWRGERDIHAAVDYLRHRPDVDPRRVAGVGFSVGGELMLQAAAENAGLAAVVSEGAGTRTLSEEMEEFDRLTLIRGFHTLLAKDLAVKVLSNEAPPPPLMDLVPHIAPRPALLIWAPDDNHRETMTPAYRRLIGPSAHLWTIRDAKHVAGYQADPEEYERRVVGFLDDALLDPSAPRARG